VNTAQAGVFIVASVGFTLLFNLGRMPRRPRPEGPPMICQPCRDAADQQAPADQHCGRTPGPGVPCDCQHRTDRYRRTTQEA
jgi:hypothetical protein